MAKKDGLNPLSPSQLLELKWGEDAILGQASLGSCISPFLRWGVPLQSVDSGDRNFKRGFRRGPISEILSNRAQTTAAGLARLRSRYTRNSCLKLSPRLESIYSHSH